MALVEVVRREELILALPLVPPQRGLLWPVVPLERKHDVPVIVGLGLDLEDLTNVWCCVWFARANHRAIAHLVLLLVEHERVEAALLRHCAQVN